MWRSHAGLSGRECHRCSPAPADQNWEDILLRPFSRSRDTFALNNSRVDQAIDSGLGRQRQIVLNSNHQEIANPSSQSGEVHLRSVERARGRPPNILLALDVSLPPTRADPRPLCQRPAAALRIPIHPYPIAVRIKMKKEKNDKSRMTYHEAHRHISHVSQGKADGRIAGEVC